MTSHVRSALWTLLQGNCILLLGVKYLGEQLLMLTFFDKSNFQTSYFLKSCPIMSPWHCVYSQNTIISLEYVQF